MNISGQRTDYILRACKILWLHIWLHMATECAKTSFLSHYFSSITGSNPVGVREKEEFQ